jgi:hypothetical protein
MSFSILVGGELPAQVRPRPAFLRALGADEPPQCIEIAGIPCVLRDVFKHDSWAATALYAAQDGSRFICKFNRQQSLFGLPLSWLGRILARREAFFLSALGDMPNVPAPAGAVTSAGRPLPNAVARHYLPGHPLGPFEPVNDEFFPRLVSVLREMHRRGFAYVDLHKCENVIVGDDGQPYLIDFQISQGLWSSLPVVGRFATAILHMLQRSDLYHLAKMQRRARPDQAPATGQSASERPWWIRLHRLIAVPFRTFRRRLLVSLHIRSGKGKATSEEFAEDAFRQVSLNRR